MLLAFGVEHADLYLWGFALSTLALLLWNGFERQRVIANVAPLVVLLGLLTMGNSLISMQLEVDDKLFNFARDLLLQASMAYLIRLLSQKPKLLLPAIIALAALYWFGYREVQIESLNVATEQDVPELLYVPDAPLTPQEIEELGELEGVQSIAPAFTGIAANDPLAAVYVIDLADEVSSAAQARIQVFAAAHNDFLDLNETLTVAPIPAKARQLTEHRGPNPSDIGLNDPGVAEQWALSAWPYAAFAKTSQQFLRKLKPATLFILDTGIDAQHPDLKANYRSVAASHDRDAVGHGTHVAGIAAGVANNGLGIAGWLPAGEHPIKVSSIRVFGAFNRTSQQAIVQGMIDAVNAGASVINLSLGGLSSDSRQRVYERAVKMANEKGCIVVAAAGNSAADARRYAPANTPGIIAVAALNNQLQQARFSNSIDGLELGLWAPGQDIFSTVPNGGFTLFSGTSMAAPQVAGLLAVAKALQPALTTREAHEMLVASTQTRSFGNQNAPDIIDPGNFLERVGER